jgi:putative PEP-CTERM system histidine kinase
MFETIALWSHATAAALFGVLAIWIARLAASDRARLPLAIACAATSIWGITVALFDHSHLVTQISEAGRNIGWLGYMYAIWRQAGGEHRTVALTALYATLATVIVLGFGVSVSPLLLEGSPRILNAVFFTAIILDLMIAVGILMLIHNLYTAATSEARTVLRLPLIALAIIWIYDLNLFTISYLSGDWSRELIALRGAAVAITAPLIALAVSQAGRATISLSRSATFQSLSLVAIGGYLVAMVLLTSLIDAIAGQHARLVQVAFVFGTSVLGLALFPSPKFRAWFRVKVSKHLFQHRYDYRAEWLRFTDTIGRPSADSASLDVRIIQALADITESSGGLLLVPDESGALAAQARWNWDAIDVPSHAGSAASARHFCSTGRIIELDGVRANPNGVNGDINAAPEWLIQDMSAWAMIPLVHFERLLGVVVLQRPIIDRTLDWEDFDLLRVVGRQLASYIAEARGQETLSQVQQFDEFNRRFAFIMHDIKNLVSQLSLVTRNAEKHAGNPEFQVDMIATLKSSTARMNGMLARLSQHNRVKVSDPISLEVGPFLDQVVASKRAAHPIVLGGDLGLYILADGARLMQALAHLIQNAIEASSTSDPVTVMAKRVREEAYIEVCDRGAGMSADFIRHMLFKPFSSTKEGGFGIGAFEARSLVMAMNGRLEVSSREGEGTIFRIILPIPAGEDTAFNPLVMKVA